MGFNSAFKALTENQAALSGTYRAGKEFWAVLTLSNPIFLPTAYSPALICLGR
jgi:hypothetical protein